MARGSEKVDKAVSEAACWLLALEKQSGNDDLYARFEAWLSASPANRSAWSEISRFEGLIAAPEQTARRVRREAQPTVTAPLTVESRIGRRIGLALVALVAAAAIALFAPVFLLRLNADHLTATAETRSVTLADRSTVALAPGSAIEIVPGQGRTVRLLKGEALFKVTPDPGRPFRVLANGVATTALATEFDVRLHQEGAVVAVREGEVRIDRTNMSERLEAGDWASIAEVGIVARGALPPREIAAWQSGRIIARDRPIDEVVEEIGRSFSGVIFVAQASFGRRRATGVYDLADPEAALRVLVGVHGGTVRRFSPWLLVIVGS